MATIINNGESILNEWIIVSGLIVIMIIAIAIFSFNQHRKVKEIRKKHPGYPEGYWINQGISIGIALGAGVGVALDSLAIGIGGGIAIGAGIGKKLTNDHADEIRPITDEEKKLRRQTILFTTATLILGILAFLFIHFAIE